MKREKKKPLARRAAGWIVNGIFILGALAFAGTLLGGCAGAGDFVHGFRDESLRQAPAIGAEALTGSLVNAAMEKVSSKLGAEVSAAVKGALDSLPSKIPQPAPPPDNTVGYGLGVLVATLVANGVKGYIRGRKEKGTEE